MTAHLRLLEVISDNRMGGISVRALSAAGPLRRQGIESIFIVPREPGDVADTCRDRGFQVYQTMLNRPHPRRLWQTLVWLVSFPWSVWQIIRLIRRTNADVVHVNGMIGLQAAVAAKWSGTPLIWHLAGTRSYPRWFVRLLRPLIRSSECVVSISPRVAAYFLGKGDAALFPEKRAASPFFVAAQKKSCVPFFCRVIFEPVDLAEIERRRQGGDRAGFRRELGLGDDDRVICTVGNLSPVKGTLVLIEAARRLCETDADLQFLVVGAELETQRDYVERIQAAIRGYGLQDRVRLLGQRRDVYEILRASDLFVLPSLSEGTPISILEAMAHRVPVIASDVGGIPDQIENGVSGSLVPVGDAAALADAIAGLLHDQATAKTFAEAAYERVTRQFSLDEFVSVFADTVRTVHHATRKLGAPAASAVPLTGG